ncbi:MAG TPA: YggS family pyridoxal phosphate-dependent enzyme [Thermoanaerobaculia bacterium]|nr:YggS family pyridoxal phosphate-dependent enzyme [Thermoanaerobaculia bacterium]
MFGEVVPANLARIEEEIAAACSRSGRSRDEVRLIAVAKTFPAAAVDEAIRAGITDVGENRVQEAREKIDRVTGRARWHMIGHLQSNKVKEAVRIFDVIQSIDSLPLALKVDRECALAERKIDVLIQVNLGGESQKYGVSPDAVPALARSLESLDHVTLRGLMSIPPMAPPERARAWFRDLRRLRDSMAGAFGSELAGELSMGMSDDFPVAIEEGATMIRIGRAIFGERTSE